MRKAKAPRDLIERFRSGFRFIETAVHEHEEVDRWTKGRIALVGDAAHAMSPFLGQGANQTIQDAHGLALQIREAIMGGISIEEALHRYEGMFKEHTRAIQHKSKMLGQLLTQGGVVGGKVRNIVLGIVGLSGLLNRQLVSSFLPRTT